MIDVIELVDYQIEYDLIGSPHQIEVKRKTYCEVKSITQAEYYKAKEQRINIKYCVKLKAFDYKGEAYVIFKNNRYKVIRTYAIGDNMELYLGD